MHFVHLVQPKLKRGLLVLDIFSVAEKIKSGAKGSRGDF